MAAASRKSRGKTQSLSWLAGYANLSPDCKSLLCATGRSSESLLFCPRGERFWKVLDCVVNVPHVSAQGIGSSLQGPGEEGQLPSEMGLVEQLGLGAEQGQVLSECAQRVVAPAVQNVPERSLYCGHVLREEVVLHLQTHTHTHTHTQTLAQYMKENHKCIH